MCGAGLVPGDPGQDGVPAMLCVALVSSTRLEYAGGRHPALGWQKWEDLAPRIAALLPLLVCPLSTRGDVLGLPKMLLAALLLILASMQRVTVIRTVTVRSAMSVGRIIAETSHKICSACKSQPGFMIVVFWNLKDTGRSGACGASVLTQPSPLGDQGRGSVVELFASKIGRGERLRLKHVNYVFDTIYYHIYSLLNILSWIQYLKGFTVVYVVCWLLLMNHLSLQPTGHGFVFEYHY